MEDRNWATDGDALGKMQEGLQDGEEKRNS